MSACPSSVASAAGIQPPSSLELPLQQQATGCRGGTSGCKQGGPAPHLPRGACARLGRAARVCRHARPCCMEPVLNSRAVVMQAGSAALKPAGFTTPLLAADCLLLLPSQHCLGVVGAAAARGAGGSREAGPCRRGSPAGRPRGPGSSPALHPAGAVARCGSRHTSSNSNRERGRAGGRASGMASPSAAVAPAPAATATPSAAAAAATRDGDSDGHAGRQQAHC